ncbi:MAG TPA: helix-turn-helix transcriptional regulator [Bacteroidia bacterium]|nr:helix-turn-helix transcriptional regulator [Bacteroidia bacterium]
MAVSKDPTKKFLAAVGEKIRHYRLKRGLTLEALGEDIGLDKANVHKIESGQNITLRTLLKVAAFLEVKPVDLISDGPLMAYEEAEDYVRRQKRKRKASRR